MGWYCVHIDHKRLAAPVNHTFRNMLIAEYRALGEPKDCRVYRDFHTDGSFSYLFSPAAAEKMAVFVDFWEAFGISEPTDLTHMRLIVGHDPPEPSKIKSPSSSSSQGKPLEPPNVPENST